MKGCPFNNFGPCKKDECVFYFTEGYHGCMFINHYCASLLLSDNLISLISLFLREGFLTSSELTSSEAEASLKELVDFVLPRLQDLSKRLKDVES
jgi:hypothetical protein